MTFQMDRGGLAVAFSEFSNVGNAKREGYPREKPRRHGGLEPQFGVKENCPVNKISKYEGRLDRNTGNGEKLSSQVRPSNQLLLSFPDVTSGQVAMYEILRSSDSKTFQVALVSFK